MFQKLLKKIARKLSAFSIPYMVIGGQAVLVYGEPRLTKDIDITLGLGVEGFERIRDVIVRLNLIVLVDDVETFVKKTMVVPCLDKKSGIRVDFIFSHSPYERQALERAKAIRFGNSCVKFASLEDVVIHKMVAGRARDIEDVKSILGKNSGYDSRYIEMWLKEFDNSLGENFFTQYKKILEEIK